MMRRVECSILEHRLARVDLLAALECIAKLVLDARLALDGRLVACMSYGEAF